MTDTGKPPEWAMREAKNFWRDNLGDLDSECLSKHDPGCRCDIRKTAELVAAAFARGKAEGLREAEKYADERSRNVNDSGEYGAGKEHAYEHMEVWLGDRAKEVEGRE